MWCVVERDEILKKVRELRPWYHNVYLGDGIWTKDLTDPENISPGADVPRPLWEAIENVIPQELRGMRALDVGCGAGFFSFKLRERGARVVGIDNDQGATVSFIKQAEFCTEVLGMDIDFRRQALLEISEDDHFDLILFLGVFYHIPNFCDSLEKIYRLCKPGGFVAVESQVAPRSLTCYEGKGFRGDLTTYFIPSKRIFNTFAEECGFQIVREFSTSEERYFFLCVRPSRSISMRGRLPSRGSLRRVAKRVVPGPLWKRMKKIRGQLLRFNFRAFPWLSERPSQGSAPENKAGMESDSGSLARFCLSWRHGYGVEYEVLKSEFIRAAVRDDNLLELFRREGPLPSGYGVGVDERCIEYPWLIAHTVTRPERYLDAGSALNHDFIIEHPSFKGKELHILTQAPEANCFWSKGISYFFADLRDIPIRDNYYDTIGSISTIEHVGHDNTDYTRNEAHRENKQQDFLLCIKELRRLLKPGGTLLFTVPFGVHRRFRTFQQFDLEHLTRAVEAFGETLMSDFDFYRYTASGWIRAEGSDCATCEYVEWITHQRDEWPEPFPVQPDFAIAARAVACVRLVKL